MGDVRIKYPAIMFNHFLSLPRALFILAVFSTFYFISSKYFTSTFLTTFKTCEKFRLKSKWENTPQFFPDVGNFFMVDGIYTETMEYQKLFSFDLIWDKKTCSQFFECNLKGKLGGFSMFFIHESDPRAVHISKT